MRVKDARQTFLGIWVRLLLEGQSIKVFGDGLQLRDFNYVDDCVEALISVGAADDANGKVYNLGSTEVLNLKELAELLIHLHGSGSYEIVPFPQDRKGIDVGDYYGDFSNLQRELAWTPKVSLREGLSKTLDYYALNRRHYWEDFNLKAR